VTAVKTAFKMTKIVSDGMLNSILTIPNTSFVLVTTNVWNCCFVISVHIALQLCCLNSKQRYRRCC